jgi:hypothetical protein
MVLSPLLAFFSQAWSANSRHVWLNGSECRTRCLLILLSQQRKNIDKRASGYYLVDAQNSRRLGHQVKNSTTSDIALLLYYEVQVNWSNVRVKYIVFSKYRTGDTVPDKNVIQVKAEVSHSIPRKYILILDVTHQILGSKPGIPRRNTRWAKKTDGIIA